MPDRNIKLFFKKLLEYFNDGQCLIELSVVEQISENPDICKKHLDYLSKEGYIDVIYTDKHGIPFAYIALKKKGIEFLTIKKRRKTEILSKLGLTFISALVTFIFGKLIYALFS